MISGKTYFFTLVSICSLWLFSASAENTDNATDVPEGLIAISGTLPPVVKEQGKPYLVTSTIVVDAGQKVKIEKGVILLFKNFTGLEVKGNIWVEGTSNEPVIFTSENNRVYNTKAPNEPAPFDWDGITLYYSGSNNVFEHCLIEYSLFGIKSETEKIVLKECSFDQNGNTDFTVSGQEQLITAFSYSYNAENFDNDRFSSYESKLVTEPEPQINAEPQKEIGPEPQEESSSKVDLKPEKKRQKASKVALTPDGTYEKRSSKKYGKVTWNLLSLGAMIAGGALGVIETKKYLRAQNTFDEVNELTHENKMKERIRDDWQAAKDNVNLHAAYMSVGYGAAALGLTVFTITLFF